MQQDNKTISITAQELLDEGLHCYNQKNLKGALYFFEQLFIIDSNNEDLIFTIVSICQELKDFNKATAYINTLIKISPQNEKYLFVQAENNFYLHNYIEAIPLYRHLSNIHPLNTHILKQLLAIYTKQNNLKHIKEIQGLLQQAEEKTNDSKAEIVETVKVALTLVEQGRNEEAKLLIEGVLLFDVDNINANGIYGAILSDEGKEEESLFYLDKIAFSKANDYVSLYAVNLTKVRDPAAAIAYLEKRIIKYPLENNTKRLLVDYYFNSQQYACLYRLSKSIKKIYQGELDFDKKYALSRFIKINEENKWLNQDNLESAAKVLYDVLERDPEESLIAIQLINYYINISERKLAYDLICKTNFPEESYKSWAKHHYYGAIRDRESYFKSYIAGRPARPIMIDVKRFANKIWNGESLKNKKVVILREQGVGDEILFASNYNWIINEAQHVDVFCSPRLKLSFTRIFPTASFHAVIENNTNINLSLDKEHYILSADTIILAGDLATLHFQSTGIPLHKENYFTISEARKKHWEKKLISIVKEKKPTVGLIWRSGMINSARSAHYLTDKEVAKIITALPDVEFVSCMYVECKKEIGKINKLTKRKIHEISDLDQKNDFENTAAMLSCLDLLVGAYTATLSLAMAVGTPAVAYSADYVKEDGIIEKEGLYYDNLSHISLPIFDKDLRSVAIDAIINSIKSQLKL